MEKLEEKLKDANETAFSRLGSSKALYALTNGEMEAAPITNAVAADSALTHDICRQWVGELTGPLGSAVEKIATTAGDRHQAINDNITQPADSTIKTTLTQMTRPPARAGGLFAWALVREERLGQVTGFFVGNADPRAASQFRSYRAEVSTEADQLAEAIVTQYNDTDSQQEAVNRAANDIIEAAYDEYVTTLQSLGIEPKNVC